MTTEGGRPEGVNLYEGRRHERMGITLRDVIEVYEEKLRDLQSRMDDAEEEARRESENYQTREHGFNRTMERIKRCRGRECRALAREYEDSYPYRRRLG